MKKVETALIGFGPANLGLLVAMIRRGNLKEMARGGLIVVEASRRLGAGAFSDYKITANSLASVFLECVEDPKLANVFEAVTDHPVIRKFRSSQDTAPLLPDVAAVLEAIAKTVLSYVAREVNLTVLTGSHATSWERTNTGHAFTVKAPEHNITVQAQSAFVNCGGQGLPLEDTRIKTIAPIVLHGDAILKMEPSHLAEVCGKGTVAIIGGSHSGISCAQRLSAATNVQAIEIFSRSPLKLFYSSTKEAALDAYDYDPIVDVCPLSGRINRFGGLRYDAHIAAKEISRAGRISSEGSPVSFSSSLDPVATANAKAPFAVAVIATGYQSAGPCGASLQTQCDGRVRDITGKPIPNLYSFGLGSGLKPSERIGGEKSYSGRLDGYWLYQYDVGDEVLDAYFEDQQQ